MNMVHINKAGGDMSSVRHLFLQGDIVYLRALEEADLGGSYFQWLNDEDVSRHNYHAVFPNSEKQMRAFFESAQDFHSQVVLAICDKDGDRHIGNVSLQDIDWVARSAAFAIMIGERDYWGRRIGSEVGRLVLEFAFDRLNLRRISCGTTMDNLAMQKVAERLGMKQEGIRRQALFKLGRYVDVVEYGVFRDEFFTKVGREVNKHV